jgi:hypothetical protein
MKALFIEESKATPKVNFNPNGELFIHGRSLPEDPVGFYTPVLDWIKNCACETVVLNMKLEYLNTSSSKQVFSLLSLMNENPLIKNKSVNWHYEEGDDESYETGKAFESLTNIQFRFFEYAEIPD